MGCRAVRPPDELVRVVATPDGRLVVGRGLPGRGAWLCADTVSCLDAAARRKAFAWTLRTEIAPDAVDLLRLQLADRARIGGYGPHPAGDETERE